MNLKNKFLSKDALTNKDTVILFSSIHVLENENGIKLVVYERYYIIFKMNNISRRMLRLNTASIFLENKLHLWNCHLLL
jgi:hypothetical protein